MPNRLAHALSPYLRSHADNPVAWYPWGEEAFAEAERRQVPVLISIGYSTCHWCHVMARESFSDSELAGYLNEHFVAIKVDREEHPEVDASYLAAAGAFVSGLGWPLTVFTTPAGKTFYAGTYFPPAPIAGHPAFRQVLEAVTDAWENRRAQVVTTADQLVSTLSAAVEEPVSELPGSDALGRAVATLTAAEDTVYGGFGTAPKFPIAPVLGFLLATPAGAESRTLAVRTLRAMAASPIRDAVDGGFFRYATRRDWSDPHYERMLYDNALLLRSYTDAWKLDPAEGGWAAECAAGIAGFLLGTLRLPGGCFASAQDSESTVGGRRAEGGFYALDAEARAAETPPDLDDKVLTGWNGLAIEALAHAGFAFGRQAWVRSARDAADELLRVHLIGEHRLARASSGGRLSTASATLEDYGMLACGLLEVAKVTGEESYASHARGLIDAVLADAGPGASFGVPDGRDPVLVARGLALALDPSEGAYPSGLSSCARACLGLYLLTADARYRTAAAEAVGRVALQAVANPASFGGALEVLATLAAEPVQLVVVTGARHPEPGDQLRTKRLSKGRAADVLDAARLRAAPVFVAVTTERQAKALADAGFGLFTSRSALEGKTTAYLCRDFVCRLPVTDAAGLLTA